MNEASTRPATTAAGPKGMAGRVAKVIAWALRLRAVRVWFHYLEHRGAMLADSVTYRTLFSTFAGVLLGFSLAALWLSGNPAAWQALIDAVDSAIPGLVGPDGLISVSEIQAPAGMTIAGILSLVGLVGAAIGAVGSLRAAMRNLADEVHDDSFWLWVILRNLLLAIAIGGGFIITAGVTFIGSTFAGSTLDWLGVGSDTIADVTTRAITVLAVFLLDAGLIALAFVALSGVKARKRTLWGGAVIGGIGLTVLQQLSGLFVAGANANPLLASFAALIALLLWFNLSAQVILLASTWVIVGVAEDEDRVRARYGAPSFALRRVQRAEDVVSVATQELKLARRDADREREKALGKEDSDD